MIKHNEKLITVSLTKGVEKLVELDRIYPLGKIDFQGELTIECSYENKEYFPIELEDNSFINSSICIILLYNIRASKLKESLWIELRRRRS